MIAIVCLVYLATFVIYNLSSTLLFFSCQKKDFDCCRQEICGALRGSSFYYYMFMAKNMVGLLPTSSIPPTSQYILALLGVRPSPVGVVIVFCFLCRFLSLSLINIHPRTPQWHPTDRFWWQLRCIKVVFIFRCCTWFITVSISTNVRAIIITR